MTDETGNGMGISRGPSVAFAAAELLRRREALQSLEAYVRYMREHGCESRYFQYDVHPVQRPLVSQAERLIAGDLKAASTSCPPSLSKSTVFSIWAVTWAMARNPKLRILWATHTDALVQLFARERRNIFNSQAWQTLAGTSLTDPNMAADTLQFASGGSVISRSAGGSVTGLRADLLIGDDLVSGADEARSRPMLDQLNTWLLSDFLSRRDGAHSRFVLVGTRWSVWDPIGRLLEMSQAGLLQAEHLRIPMVCDDEDHDPLGRGEGEWIDWPGRFDDDDQRRVWQRNHFMWRTLYQNLPYDTAGGFCQPEDVALVLDAPAGTRVMGGDFAMTDSSKADYTVFASGVVHRNRHGEKALCITHVWREQKNARDVAAAFADRIERHRPMLFACERDGASRVYLDSALPGECRRRGLSMPYVHRLPAAGASKEVKASPLRGLIQRGLLSFVVADWNHEVVDELVRFPGGDNDDTVDAVAALARVLDKVPAGEQDAAPVDPFASPPIVERDGRLYLNRPLEALFQEHERGMGSGYSKGRV